MSNSTHRSRLSHYVRWSLLVGVTLSGLLLATGFTIAAFRGQTAPQHVAPSITAVIKNAVLGDGVALMQLGLFVMILTPLVRVAVLAIGWANGESWHYAAVALSVLALLCLSIYLGFG